jgi:hypothetical protein
MLYGSAMDAGGVAEATDLSLESFSLQNNLEDSCQRSEIEANHRRTVGRRRGQVDGTASFVTTGQLPISSSRHGLRKAFGWTSDEGAEDANRDAIEYIAEYGEEVVTHLL